DFSSRKILHTATELACGLVAPVAVISGFIWRGHMLVRRLKWELILLLIVLSLCMIPTAGFFRWSFRWLPFFHLVLAVCAAEALRSFQDSRRPWSATLATAALALVILTAIAISIFHTGGNNAFPLVWIFFGLPALWFLLDFFFPIPEFVTGCLWLSRFRRCLRHISASRRTAVCRDTTFLKSCLNPRHSIRLAFISASTRGRS